MKLYIIKKSDIYKTTEQRFIGKTGFQFNFDKGTRPDLGYVLVSRYDGLIKSPVVEFWDINNQKLLHNWNFEKIGLSKFQWIVHPLLGDNGEIWFGSDNYFGQLDVCSKNYLKVENNVHHSLEFGDNSTIWTSGKLEPKSVELGSRIFNDHSILNITKEGTKLFEKSITQILIDNGLRHLIVGTGSVNDDPIHANDVEPVFEDGKHWKKGDLFVSIRHQSLVFLYRPSENKVVWFQQGPWIHQHDVNIIDENTISVFDNNAPTAQVSTWVVDGNNRIAVYDFERDKISFVHEDVLQNLDIRTPTQGRARILGNEIFVEETDYGRLISFSQNKNLNWEYVNRADDGHVYVLKWSRLIDRERGKKIANSLEKQDC